MLSLIKIAKKLDNSPEQWRIFENTHEAIIDKETFEIVQKIRSGKRRPTKMGDMPMFSGLLYCADCGSKMTFHRQMAQSAEKHNFDAAITGTIQNHVLCTIFVM